MVYSISQGNENILISNDQYSSCLGYCSFFYKCTQRWSLSSSLSILVYGMANCCLFLLHRESGNRDWSWQLHSFSSGTILAIFGETKLEKQREEACQKMRRIFLDCSEFSMEVQANQSSATSISGNPSPLPSLQCHIILPPVSLSKNSSYFFTLKNHLKYAPHLIISTKHSRIWNYESSISIHLFNNQYGREYLAWKFFYLQLYSW